MSYPLNGWSKLISKEKKQNIWDKKFTNKNESGKIEKRKPVGVNDNRRITKTSVINQSQKCTVEFDIQKQSLKSLKSYEKRISKYINNPYLKIKDFDKKDKRYQKGIKK